MKIGDCMTEAPMAVVLQRASRSGRRTCEEAGDKSCRCPRARSSPSRSEHMGDRAARTRSPSLSPAPLPPPSTPDGDGGGVLDSAQSAARELAYFTWRPPPVPLWLALIPEQRTAGTSAASHPTFEESALSSSVSRLHLSRRESEELFDSLQGPAQFANAPASTTAPTSTPAPITTFVPECVSRPTSATASGYDGVPKTEAPSTPAPDTASALDCPRRESKRRNNTLTQRCTSPAPLKGPRTTCPAQTSAQPVPPRHVSIQTQQMSKTIGCDDREHHSFLPSDKRNDWASSVRALRDGHLRLALRALRELRRAERLHRALSHGPSNGVRSPARQRYNI